jgi:hypothetical protein
MTCWRVILALLYLKKATHIVLKQDAPNDPVIIDLHLSLPHIPKKRIIHEMRSINLWDLEQDPIKESLFYYRIMHTWLFKDYLYVKSNLDNYEGLTNSWKHIQKYEKHYWFAMCKVLPIKLHWFACAWYNNLELVSIFMISAPN